MYVWIILDSRDNIRVVCDARSTAEGWLAAISLADMAAEQYHLTQERVATARDLRLS